MFTDALIMDRTWPVEGGFLGFSARFARTGIQMYDGSEIDPEGTHKLADGSPKFARGTLYPVDRPAKEVFSNRALASFIAKPLTNDHPSKGVDVNNWRDLTGGVIGETLRDGEYARLSGLMTDKALIADYRAGKKELSGGYSATLLIGDGVNAAGEAFVATQTAIDGNHVAFVDRGRAGSECRVTDAAHCEAAPKSIFDSLPTTEKTVMKTMLIDGLTVDIGNADTAQATIATILQARDTATGKVTTLEAAAVADAATIVTKDAEIVKLTAEKKALEDAKPTPAQLRDAAKSFAIVVAKGKSAGITVTDVMDEAAIMKAVVDKAMGDKAKDYTADKYALAFDVLTKDAKITDADVIVPLGAPTVIGDTAASETARAAMIADMHKPSTVAA
jgi:hypothetical protein